MSTEPFFDARIIDDDILVVLIRGSLDSTTTPEFDREIQRHLDEGRSKIIIDCRYLDYLTSMAIGRLIVLQKRMRSQGGEVKLATIHGPAAKIIEQVALGKVLDIYPDLEFARESFYEERAPRRSLLKRLVWSIPVILALLVGVVVVVRLTWKQSESEPRLGENGVAFDSAMNRASDDLYVDDVRLLDGPAGPNQPPLANDNAYNNVKDTQLVVSAPGLLEYDTDPNPGDTLTIGIVDSIGTLGTVDYWNDDGSFAYTPPAGYTGADTFRYIATDGELSSNPATVTITTSEVSEPTLSSTDGQNL